MGQLDIGPSRPGTGYRLLAGRTPGTGIELAEPEPPCALAIELAGSVDMRGQPVELLADVALDDQQRDLLDQALLGDLRRSRRAAPTAASSAAPSGRGLGRRAGRRLAAQPFDLGKLSSSSTTSRAPSASRIRRSCSSAPSSPWASRWLRASRRAGSCSGSATSTTPTDRQQAVEPRQVRGAAALQLGGQRQQLARARGG